MAREISQGPKALATWQRACREASEQRLASARHGGGLLLACEAVRAHKGLQTLSPRCKSHAHIASAGCRCVAELFCAATRVNNSYKYAAKTRASADLRCFPQLATFLAANFASQVSARRPVRKTAKQEVLGHKLVKREVPNSVGCVEGGIAEPNRNVCLPWNAKRSPKCNEPTLRKVLCESTQNATPHGPRFGVPRSRRARLEAFFLAPHMLLHREPGQSRVESRELERRAEICGEWLRLVRDASQTLGSSTGPRSPAPAVADVARGAALSPPSQCRATARR